WLYVAEALFGKACYSLRWHENNLARAYQWLVQAQYIYVMLGLQGTPHTQVPRELRTSPAMSCFPGHVLTTARFAVWSADKRYQLRSEAIGRPGDIDWLYKSLLDALSGRTSCRDRISSLQAA